MSQRFLLSRRLGSVLLAASLLFGAAPLKAADAPAVQTLEISPVKYDIVLEKGSSSQQVVSLTNRLITPIQIHVAFRNLLDNGEDGGTKAVDETTPYDLKKWASLSETDFTLNGKEAKKVNVTLNVPVSAEAGGHYGILQFIPTALGGGSVAVSGSIATLFLVRIPGAITEKGSLDSFNLTRQDGKAVDGFLLGADLVAVTKIHNEGNVHFPIAPTVTVTNQFGKQVFKDQAPDANVFPQSKRKYESKLNNLKTGYYTVTTHATFKSGDQTKVLKVLVVTPMAILIALAVLILLILAILFTRRRREKIAA